MDFAPLAYCAVSNALDTAVRRLARTGVNHAQTSPELDDAFFILGKESIKDNRHLVVFKCAVFGKNANEHIARLVKVAAQPYQLRPCVDDIVAVDDVVFAFPCPSHAAPRLSPYAGASPRT